MIAPSKKRIADSQPARWVVTCGALYLTHDGRFVSQQSHAARFGSSRMAMAWCLRGDLSSARRVVRLIPRKVKP